MRRELYLVILLCAASFNAAAGQLTLVYNDTFTSADSIYPASGSPVNFSANTPFQVTASFDPSAPVFSLPGFNAYAPSVEKLTVGGQSYFVTDADVSVFDPSNHFAPGLYGVGFIQNPAQDQEGFVQDYTSASPGFTVNNLVPTTFVGYNGTGFQPGSANPPGCNQTNTCTGNNNTPLHLISASTGAAFLLTTGNRDSGPSPAGSAALYSTPEPGTVGLALIGLMLLGWAHRAKAASKGDARLVVVPQSLNGTNRP